jgi:hypothetical protein
MNGGAQHALILFVKVGQNFTTEHKVALIRLVSAEQCAPFLSAEGGLISFIQITRWYLQFLQKVQHLSFSM